MDYHNLITLKNFKKPDLLGALSYKREIGNRKIEQIGFTINGSLLNKEILKLGDTELLGECVSNEQRKNYIHNLQKVSKNIEILFCSECADLYCGYITVDISEVGDKIIWDSFRSRIPDEKISENDLLKNNPVLIFNATQYYNLINSLLV